MINFNFFKNNKNLRLPRMESLKIGHGTRVLLRVDYNVPMKNGRVVEPWRIERTLKTIKYLLEREACVIIISHLGRPGGKHDPALSLAPVAAHLGALLNTPVEFYDSLPPHVSLKKYVGGIGKGCVGMLQNLRFSPGEESNDYEFVKGLAELGEVYVNDAFGVCHREAASLTGLPKLMPHAAGLLLEQEVKMLGKLLGRTAKPFTLVMGGAKISDKIGVIKNLLPKADKVLLGGALANNFFAALGYSIGASLYDSKEVELAKSLLCEKKICLPHDVVVGIKGAERSARVVTVDKNSKKLAGANEAILDIGTDTIGAYAEQIKKSATIVWNGPMGYFEEPQFGHGTLALARTVASRSRGPAFGVVGGGETVEALRRTKMEEMVDWVSTGGGAMLEFLEGKMLPGIKALL